MLQGEPSGVMGAGRDTAGQPAARDGAPPPAAAEGAPAEGDAAVAAAAAPMEQDGAGDGAGAADAAPAAASSESSAAEQQQRVERGMRYLRVQGDPKAAIESFCAALKVHPSLVNVNYRSALHFVLGLTLLLMTMLLIFIKFIFSEKATKICEISSNLEASSEYMNPFRHGLDELVHKVHIF